MQLNKIIVLSFALLSNAFAADIQPSGTVDYALKPSGKSRITYPQKIKLLNFKLSEHAISALRLKTQSLHHARSLQVAANTPEEKQLGMNGVPVLNQGSFGTCVTFANTAAVDALLGKGDYLSQLCLLQLGNYYTEQAFGLSGWDGSLNRAMLSRLEDHGFISKETEHTVGCGGLTEYPQNGDPTPTSTISFDDYHRMSEGLIQNHISWSSILDPYTALFSDSSDTDNTVNEIKKALNNNQRVIIAVLLPAIDLGLAGAVGKHHAVNDTWVLSTLIERDLYLTSSFFFPAHALVITGYDDNAIAIDDLGDKHRGLLTLRNSWGEQFGNKGDFYMSYDYFKVLGFEAHQMMQNHFDDDNRAS